MDEVKLYTSTEVAEQLGIKRQSVTRYFQVHAIGKKYGSSVMFTAEDIQKIRDTDGRRK